MRMLPSGPGTDHEVEAVGFNPANLLRVQPSTFSYWLSLTAIIIGFYAYWIFWKARLLYFGWIGALFILGFFALRLPPLRLRSEGLGRSALPLITWYLYLGISANWSPDPALTLYHVLFGMPMAFVVGFLWARNCTTRQLARFFVVQALVFLPIVLISLFSTGELYGSDRGSVRSLLAGQLVVAIPFLVWRARNRGSWIHYVLTGIVGLLLAATGSRSGPVVGLLMLLGAITFVQRTGRQKLRGVLQATVVLVTFGALAITIPQVRSGLSYAIRGVIERNTQVTLESGDELPADYARIVQNLVAFREFRADPLRGGGYMSTFAITKEAGIPVAAHGLALFGEVGLIGIAIFVWLLSSYFRRTRIAAESATTDENRAFWETCRLAMIGMLLYGVFHQVERTSEFLVLLSFGYAGRYTDAAP